MAATLCLSGGVARSSDAKTHLIRDAVVNGQSIYLSDLLPESSPSAVRIPAREILIGRSPQAGSTRVLSGGDIVRVLNDGDLLGQVDVPEQIVVHRLGHLVTREEVAEAIRRMLAGNQTFGNVQIAPEDVRFAARVMVPAQNAELHVTRVELDPALQKMKFWLASGAEPALLPFMAMARATCTPCGSDEGTQPLTTQNSPQQIWGTITSTSAERARPTLDSGRPGNSAPPLVEAGKTALLHLVSGPQMQMYLAAVALERGVFGQTVRVRIQSTGKVLFAHVVGRNQLEANL